MTKTSNAKRCAKYRARDPERVREHHARWRDERRLWIDGKKSAPCKDCGGTFPPECMDFDHVSGVKEFEIAGSYARVGKAKLEAEIAKCDLVCANCHRIRTRVRGVPWQRNHHRIAQQKEAEIMMHTPAHKQPASYHQHQQKLDATVVVDRPLSHLSDENLIRLDYLEPKGSEKQLQAHAERQYRGI